MQFYSNIDKVEAVDSIGDYSPTDYRIEYLSIQKSDKETEIQALTAENIKLNEDNKTYQNNINDLISNEEYETTEEIEETNHRIQSYQRQIERNNENVEQNKLEIAELKKAITDIESAIKKMKKKE